VRWFPVVLEGTLLGASLGLMAGLWLRGPTVPLAGLAAAGLVAAGLLFGTTVALERHRDRRQGLADERQARQERYAMHVRELSRHVFTHLPALRLDPDPAEPAEGGPAATLGLIVDGVPNPVAVERLDGWTLAVEHLRADETTSGGWASLEERARRRARARSRAVRAVEDRLSTEVLREYGFEAGLEGGRLRPAPWCDVRAIASLVVDRGEAPPPLDLTEVHGAGDPLRGAGDAYSLVASSVELLRGRSPEEASRTRLARVVGSIESDRTLLAELRAARRAETDARRAVEGFARSVRGYRDRIALGADPPGVCDVCRPWRDGRSTPGDAGGASPTTSGGPAR
jgi:hypothetical protein